MSNITRAKTLENEGLKLCSKCKRILPLEDFSRGTYNGVIYYRGRCKECERTLRKIMKDDRRAISRFNSNMVQSKHRLSFLNTRKLGIELCAKGERFIKVNGIEGNEYYISNYGRLLSKVNSNGFKIIKGSEKRAKGKIVYRLSSYRLSINGSLSSCTEQLADVLTAKYFLQPVVGKERVWHIDGDSNNYYKNLIYVDDEEYGKLRRKRLKVESIMDRQKYYFLKDVKSAATRTYNLMYNRCYDRKSRYGHIDSYENVVMCDKWKHNKKAFYKWFEDNYYECDGERMALDKDLLCPGNQEYAPDKCVLLPQTLNTMLSNCKKHRQVPDVYRTDMMDLPLGVRYNKCSKKYYGVIRFCGSDELLELSKWDTADEAFEEYKEYKLFDVQRMAEEYKNRVPQKVYEALLQVDIKPYAEEKI